MIWLLSLLLLQPPKVLDGYYQSCFTHYTYQGLPDEWGFSEFIYDHYEKFKPRLEFHIGPFVPKVGQDTTEGVMEFAVFLGIQDDHRRHDSSANLLRPYQVAVVHDQGKMNWLINGYQINVVRAGGSRDDCSGFYITVTRPP